MGSILSEVFANPQYIAGPKDVPFLTIVAVIVAGLTIAFSSAVRKRLHSDGLTVLLAGSLVPLAMFGLAALSIATTPESDIDSHGMLAVSLIVLGICIAPISFGASTVYVIRQRRRSAK
jgi:drug/metabolite transporter (DMT)-like permease